MSSGAQDGIRRWDHHPHWIATSQMCGIELNRIAVTSFTAVTGVRIRVEQSTIAQPSVTVYTTTTINSCLRRTEFRAALTRRRRKEGEQQEGLRPKGTMTMQSTLSIRVLLPAHISCRILFQSLIKGSFRWVVQKREVYTRAI